LTSHWPSNRTAVRHDDLDFFGVANEVTGRYDNALLPVNATRRDAMAGINRYDCFSRLLG
jgi:hypothetical protein